MLCRHIEMALNESMVEDVSLGSFKDLGSAVLPGFQLTPRGIGGGA